ncbi:AMP-binding protein [Bdellovibrio sp. HCB337]|uniref:AMP-binding protein n=1 Tax=Bdellovibrio sp. HCB337 TaxID=3394358 RepID=UPI0039A729AC
MQKLEIPSIQEFLEKSCRKFGNRAQFSVLELDSAGRANINSITGLDFLAKVNDLRRRQAVAGIGADSRVAMLGESSVDWIANFFAALSVGSTICSIDIKWTPHEIDTVLSHYQGSHLIVSDAWWEKALQFIAVKDHQVKLIRLSDFAKFSESILEEIPARSDRMSDLVLYTSGSTGSPKGVVLPISAVLYEAGILAYSFEPPPEELRVLFSLLPLNHVYGLSSGLFVTMEGGYELCLSQSVNPQHIQQILRERKVRRFFTIPLFLNLIKNSVEAKVQNQPLMKRLIFRLAMALNQRLKSERIAKVFFKPIREALSDTLEFFVSGGAPLDVKTARFFSAVGWPVYNGYGLTETGPVIAVNTADYHRDGSVGKPLAGVDVKIVATGDNENPNVGEIWVKGPNVFTEYYREPVLTSEAKNAQGWFRTGDLGTLDSDGYLSIVGRRKSLIVLSSGKKVQPEEVEEILEQNPQLKASCLTLVKKQGTEILVAIIELRDEVWDAERVQGITADLKKRCEVLAPYKRPQEIRLRKTPFQMTSSQKVKRHVVQYEIDKGLL